jgi:mRNA-degrading endonuclease toxin of MazEF toxin-antitoxin module
VLILTREDAIGRLHDVIAMPATGARRSWLTEVEAGPEDGMPTTSYLVAENTLLAEKLQLCERITEPGAARMSEACRALAAATGC